MSTLYQLTSEWQNLYDMMDDESMDEETVLDTIEAIDGEIEIKAEGYAAVIKQLEADQDAIKKEIDRLTARKRTTENNISRLKRSLQDSMELTGKYKFKSGMFSFNIQNNPLAVVLDEQYIENIPEEYLIPQEPKIDRKKMKEDIAAGKDLEGIAHLEQSRSLRIR